MMALSKGVLGCALLLAVCSAQSYTDTHKGSAIEVKNGNMHIDLQDPGSKMYVSVQGGEEVEIFAMAARIKTLEALVEAQAKAAEEDRKATAAKLDALEKATAAKLDALEKAAATSASTLNAKAEAVEDTLAPEISKLKDGAGVMDTRVAAVEKTASALSTLSKEIALVPKMLECSKDAQLYHPEDDKCHPPASSHCDALSTADKVVAVVAGGRLADAGLCLFNKHYGGQECAAGCLPGLRAYFTDSSGAKKYLDQQSQVSASLKCGSEGKWEATFKCEVLTCSGQPTLPTPSTMTAAFTKAGYGGGRDTVGATWSMQCNDAGATAVGKSTTSTCEYNKDSASVQWSALSGECSILGTYTLLENFIGCHLGKKRVNVGYLGRPKDFLSDVTGICQGGKNRDTCVTYGKRACEAIKAAGDECYGFAFFAGWGVQMYDNKAKTCTSQHSSGLSPNKDWDIYRREG